MRTLPRQPEGIEQLIIDGFNDLAQPSQPAPAVVGPAHLAALMGRADHLCAIQCLPATMQVIACKAFVGDIDALGCRADTGQARRGMLTPREEGFGQGVVVATGWGKTKASNHASRRTRGEQMNALIPANAAAPADVGLPCQPAPVTPSGIAARAAG